jgi:hypothetical protein
MAVMLFDPPNFWCWTSPRTIWTSRPRGCSSPPCRGMRHHAVRSHDHHFLAALSNRVLELTPEGIHKYGGGYTEYVARTGHGPPLRG